MIWKVSALCFLTVCLTGPFAARGWQTSPPPQGIQRFAKVAVWRLRVSWRGTFHDRKVDDSPSSSSIETTTVNGDVGGKIDFKLVKAKDSNSSYYQWETVDGSKPTGTLTYNAEIKMESKAKEYGTNGWAKMTQSAAAIAAGRARFSIDSAQKTFLMGAAAESVEGTYRMTNSRGQDGSSSVAVQLATGNGDWDGPVPDSGMTITGKVRQVDGPTFGMGGKKIDVSWELLPWKDEPPSEASFQFVSKDWLPDPDSPCDIAVKWKGTAEKVRVKLSGISHEPGTCLNSKSTDRDDDIIIENQGKWVVDHQGSGDSSSYTATLPLPKQDPKTAQISLKATDFGAWGKLKVDVYIDGVWVSAKETTTEQAEVNVPYDIDGNHIADKWEDDKDVKGLPPTWDEYQIAGQTAKGDGLALYEKYRGVMVLENARLVHKRLEPHEKVHFVIDSSGLFDADRWFKTSGIRAYKLTDGMVDGNRRVDYNVGSVQAGGKYASYIRKFAGDGGDPNSLTYGETHSSKPAVKWTPKTADYTNIYPDRIAAMVSRVVTNMKNALKDPSNDANKDEMDVLAKICQDLGITMADIQKAVDNIDSNTQAARAARMVALTAIHEIGHACGLEGHLAAGTDKEDEDVVRNPSCPMQYLNKEGRRRFVLFGELGGDGTFCKVAPDNCWKDLDVKN